MSRMLERRSSGFCIDNEKVASSFAAWSESESVKGTATVAEPFVAVKDGAAFVENRDELAGKVAVIGRGEIPNVQKAGMAAAAGAIGVVIVNSDEENPDQIIEMLGDDDGTTVGIPVVMVSYNDGKHLKTLDWSFVKFTGQLCNSDSPPFGDYSHRNFRSIRAGERTHGSLL